LKVLFVVKWAREKWYHKTMKKLLSKLAVIGGGLSLVSIFAMVGKYKQSEPVELASTPTDLSWKSWKKALLKTKDAFGDKDVGTLAASIAYGGTLAFFPLVVASVAIAGSILSEETIKTTVEGMSQYLPQDVAALISTQLVSAMDSHATNVLIAIAGVLLALFGVSGAMTNLINSLNRIYERKETRHFVKVRVLSLGLTSLMVVGMLVVLPLVVLGSDLLRTLGVPEAGIVAFSIVRWIGLAAVMSIGLSFIYRFAPDRPRAKWQWVSWGAIIATILWLVATFLFFIYVQNFSNFSNSYSLFAGIIVLMMWLNYSGMAILVGAEVNHQLEKRSAAATT